ncbi:PepSY domain-containing protein [uncultured Brevundimonas sp.]|uniref:PepSY domain-containing protein n=1 Tax=uncultured Brevundimonas sp. TaxID=213418 RepID=UPI0025F7592B|nr:PepSY domain-containing protein [uncultured Brevundimonas sp.]
MSRILVIAVAALMAWAPLSEASAQDRGRGRGPDREQSQERERPSISAGEALSIARSRARGARFVGTMASGGGTYVFRFESPEGRIFDITIDARTGRAGGG